MRKLLILLMLCVSTRAAAQSLETPSERLQVNIASGVFVGATLFDWKTTVVDVKDHNFRETNPLLAPMQSHPVAMVMVGEGLDVGSLFLARHVLRNHPRMLTTGLYLAAGFRTFLAVRNMARLETYQSMSYTMTIKLK